MTPRLLLIFAHPDDESFVAAGLSRRYADAGAQIALVTATRGEAGSRGDPPLWNPAWTSCSTFRHRRRQRRQRSERIERSTALPSGGFFASRTSTESSPSRRFDKAWGLTAGRA